MGIFGALTTAVSGLRAQSFALGQISGNIANSQTAGYKRTETSFVDLVPDSPPRLQSAGSVNAFSRATNAIQGDVVDADTDTYFAISGDGYFVVEDPEGTVDGVPLFAGNDIYTRRGDFELDRNGFLVNGSGYYLKGLPIDAVTGNPSGSLPEIIQLSNDLLAARPTTEVDYRVNLAAFPLTSSADPAVPGSELLNIASYNNNPTAGNDGFVRADDVDDFLNQSVAGGAVTAFDQNGSPANIQMRWAKIGTGPDTWNLFYLEDGQATGANAMWRNIGTNYVFGADGQLSPAINSVNLTGVTVNGVSLGSVVLDHGDKGVTQFADPAGIVKVTDLRQNGFAAGALDGVSLGDNGRLVASYTNGETIDVAELTLANFKADNLLRKVDGGAFEATADSGPATLGSQARLIGRALETSNTDIADEFTKLIVTQQAYAANTRVVSTSNEMLQEALNMLR
jgi:flagellar hook protein FlgE